MRQITITLCLICLTLPMSYKVLGQSDEIQQLVLNVEKLAQFKQILADMKKGYQVLQDGYNAIKNMSEGNFSLHKTFLDGLMQVSPTVRNYHRVADIITYQLSLVREYRNAYARFTRDNNFNPAELAYLGRVYDNLFKESIRNLDELLLVITSGRTRMTDDERLQAVDRIYNDMADKLVFLRHFNSNTTILAVQRAREKKDVQTIRRIYGLRD